jgi:hypothetical protein
MMAGVASSERAAGADDAIVVLGGPLSPLGWHVGFVEAPVGIVRDQLLAWRRSLGADLYVDEDLAPWPRCLLALNPLEAPWTTELLIGHGQGWTAYLNNDLNGGDPFPAANYLARILGVRWLVAAHQPLTAVGHASTQLSLGGPGGQPHCTTSGPSPRTPKTAAGPGRPAGRCSRSNDPLPTGPGWSATASPGHCSLSTSRPSASRSTRLTTMAPLPSCGSEFPGRPVDKRSTRHAEAGTWPDSASAATSATAASRAVMPMTVRPILVTVRAANYDRSSGRAAN